MPSVPIARIEKYIPKETPESRFVISQAYLDVEGKRLMATDGHRAIRVPVTIHEGETSGYVPPEAFELARRELKAARKLMPNGKDAIPDPWVKFQCFEDEIVIDNLLSNTQHKLKRTKPAENEKFPRIDAVIPKVSGQPTVCLNRFLIQEISAALDGAPLASDICLWIQPHSQGRKEATDQSVVIASSSGDSVVVLMPMRPGEVKGEAISKRGQAPEETKAVKAKSAKKGK